MSDTENMQEFLKHYQIAEQLIAQKSKAELAKCARLLAMNLAKYQICYGAISNESRESIGTVNIQLEAAEVLAAGMKELVATLNLLAASETVGDPQRIIH